MYQLAGFVQGPYTLEKQPKLTYPRTTGALTTAARRKTEKLSKADPEALVGLSHRRIKASTNQILDTDRR